MSNDTEFQLERLDQLEFQLFAFQLRQSMYEFMRASPDGVVFVAATERGRILACNNVFETMFGYREVEIVGEPIEKLVPERLRARHEYHRREYLKSPVARPMGKGIAMNLLGLTKSGDELHLGISLSPLQGPGGSLVVMLTCTLLNPQEVARAE